MPPRPKAFDEAEALEAARAVFWAKGYEATTTADLVTAMGIGRQSLYDTFGDKHRLYLRALRAYQEAGVTQVRALLAAAPDPLAAILDLLRRTACAPAAARQRGCMLVNAIAERAAHDPAVLALGQDHLAALQTVFEEALARAQTLRLVPRGRDLRSRARLVVVALHGLPLLGKAGADPALAGDAIDELAAALRR